MSHGSLCAALAARIVKILNISVIKLRKPAEIEISCAWREIHFGKQSKVYFKVIFEVLRILFYSNSIALIAYASMFNWYLD